LATVYTGQCDLGLFQVIETTAGGPRLQLFMRRDVAGGFVDHRVSFHLQGTSGAIDIPEPVKARVACHLVLTQIPDEGMGEALDSLGEMWRFYHARPAQPALQEPVPSRPVRLGGTTVAPVFPVTEG
jgi:hypothetical protein